MSTVTKSNREHSFDAELAEIVGIEKAILLKNVSYWCAENKRRRIAGVNKDGVWFTAESVRSLALKYPYMKKTSIGRWMTELHNDGWLRMVGQLGGKNLYAPGLLYEVWNTGGDWEAARLEITPIIQVSQNGTVEVSQNGTGGVPKWDSECPKMGHHVSQNGTPEYSNIEELYIEESATRAQKNSAYRKEAATTSKSRVAGQFAPGRGAASSNPSPNSAAPLPFASSVWANVAPAFWAKSLLSLCEDLPGDLDTGYYLGRCRDWSAEKGGKSADWLATAARFAHDDFRKNKLVTIKTDYSHGTDTSGSPAPYRSSIIDPDVIAARVERILRRSGEWTGA